METNKNIRTIALFSSLCFIYLAMMSGIPFNSAIGIGLFIFFSLKFIDGLGKTIELRDLIISLALLQWIVGPILKYHLSPDDIFYYMAVSEEEYMEFVLLASGFFILGLYFPGFYTQLNTENHILSVKSLLTKYPKIDLILIGIGVVAAIAEDFAPLSVKFFLFLIGGSRFVGLFFLIMGNRKYKWLIFSAMILWLFLDTIRDAVFHELLLWIIFLFIVIAFLNRFGTKQKFLFFIPFLALLMIIQSIKFYFREEIAIYSGTLDRAGIFTEMVRQELSSGEKTMSVSNFDAAIDRINQGWIVARIMRYTPAYEPFAKGETIITGIEASLVPRFLNPDKPKAGGRDNFERFTGKKLSENTSMGLSPLGEAYANFGIAGGILFMFLLGLFYNLYIYTVLKLTVKYPSLILWLPLLFLQVVKAETDFVVVLNHLVKASMVVALLIFAIRKGLAYKI